jgi:hypothetical protein
LLETADDTIIKSIPMRVIRDLNIDMSQYPVTKQPKSFVFDRATEMLKNKNLNSMSKEELESILPAIPISAIKNLMNNITVAIEKSIEMLKSSKISNIPLTLPQVIENSFLFFF